MSTECRPTIDRVSTAISTAISTDISVDITHSKQDPSPLHRIVNSPYPVHNSPPKSRYPFLLNPKSLFIFLWKFGPWGYVHYGKSTDYFCTPHAPFALIDQRKTKQNKTFKLYSMTERNILATRLKRNCLFSSAYFTSSFLQKIHSEFKFALLVLRRDIKLQRMFNMETCNM